MCAEKVDRLWPIDCSSPMSASTASNRSTRAPARRGHLEPRAHEQHRERRGLHRHGLAARVRPGDHEHVQFAAERGCRSARRVRGSRHGMAQLRKPEHARVADLGRASRRARSRARRARTRGRAARACRGPASISGAARRGRVRELAQHARDLALHLELGALVLVVELDERLRLDEQRGARARGVVHDAADLAAAVGAHGQHIAVVAHGEVVVRERAADVRVAQDPRERARRCARRARGPRGARRRARARPRRAPCPPGRDSARSRARARRARAASSARSASRGAASARWRTKPRVWRSPASVCADPEQLLARERRRRGSRAGAPRVGIARAAERRAVARFEDRARLRGEREALARRRRRSPRTDPRRRVREASGAARRAREPGEPA